MGKTIFGQTRRRGTEKKSKRNVWRRKISGKRRRRKTKHRWQTGRKCVSVAVAQKGARESFRESQREPERARVSGVVGFPNRHVSGCQEQVGWGT